MRDRVPALWAWRAAHAPTSAEIAKTRANSRIRRQCRRHASDIERAAQRDSRPVRDGPSTRGRGGADCHGSFGRSTSGTTGGRSDSPCRSRCKMWRRLSAVNSRIAPTVLRGGIGAVSKTPPRRVGRRHHTTGPRAHSARSGAKTGTYTIGLGAPGESLTHGGRTRSRRPGRPERRTARRGGHRSAPRPLAAQNR